MEKDKFHGTYELGCAYEAFSITVGNIAPKMYSCRSAMLRKWIKYPATAADHGVHSKGTKTDFG